MTLLESLIEFDNGEAGWSDPNVHQLLDLGYIDYEADFDGTAFWVTSEGDAFIEANQPN